nr:SDR family NAD(P)-dependent oxidoreductase [Ornithinimicrobium sp. HY1745]
MLTLGHPPPRGRHSSSSTRYVEVQVLLRDKVALVTGATRGIGRAIAELYLDHGATVIITGRDARVEAVAVELGERAHGRVCNGLDEEGVDAVVTETVANHGSVDILVNNAGIARDAMLHRMTLEDFREVIDINLQGTWLWTRSVVRHMRERGGGNIVNISSISAKAGNLGQSNYAASKAGVIALTQTTAREGARHHIRANAICPGLIRTSMSSVIPPPAWQRLLGDIPMGRPGEPNEVAQVALFLASDMSSYLTGTVIDVSGGRHM